MISDEVLMARAVRYVCDRHDLTPDALTRLDSATLDRLKSYSMSVAEDMRYNQIKYFRPFEYQQRFFATGLESDRRGVLAANRIGKTVSTCYETACHLTGLYPDWWNGYRYDHPVTAFVSGESWGQVALVLQNELLGTQDVKLQDRLGTGMIPRDCMVLKSIRADGANCITIEITHTSGQKSTLIFGNYTQEVRHLQGFKLDLAVFDEQPPDDVFSELVTRTATTQGQVLCSFTPLKGLNGLVSKFWNNEEGYKYIRVAWSDVPEYDPFGLPFLLLSTRKQLERDYLPHEREARIAGKPVMGKGAIFQIRSWPTYKPDEYEFHLMPSLERVIALDLGLINDATVISLMFWHPHQQTAWLDRQIIVKGIEEANPVAYVHHLKHPKVYGCPIVLPADGGTQGRYTMSALSVRELFESYGLNVYPHAIMNPPDPAGKVTNHKSFGINTMRQMLESGTFMVNENCTTFITQAQNYFVDEKGRYSDPDDAIDSARYALMACLQGIAEPANQDPRYKMQVYKDSMEQIKARREQERFANPLKRVYE